MIKATGTDGARPVGMQMPTMDDAQFSRWVDLLERRTGVVVPPGRKAFLVSGVRSRMRETGHASFDAYFDELLSGPRGAVEWASLVDRLTVHQTHFFRHQPSLDLVAREWLPAYLESHDGSPIHAWSVGCSTGEEAYTLAMVLDRALVGRQPPLAFGVTATDISSAALATGRGGVYPAARLDEIPQDYRSYCVELDEAAFGISEQLMKRVGFVQFNLVDIARAPLKRLDLVFCQNVLIYFARNRRAQLLEALAGLLKPGGLLILGPGEVLGFMNPRLSRLGGPQTLAYRRTD
jgi:chemotaxis methyl-accepting protein methylase